MDHRASLQGLVLGSAQHVYLCEAGRLYEGTAMGTLQMDDQSWPIEKGGSGELPSRSQRSSHGPDEGDQACDVEWKSR